MYEIKDTQERTTNYWGFTRKIPDSFYDGTTGINTTIKKLLKNGYNYHIERLMVLGNFILLCEFDPDEVYPWFMNKMDEEKKNTHLRIADEYLINI